MSWLDPGSMHEKTAWKLPECMTAWCLMGHLKKVEFFIQNFIKTFTTPPHHPHVLQLYAFKKFFLCTLHALWGKVLHFFLERVCLNKVLKQHKGSRKKSYFLNGSDIIFEFLIFFNKLNKKCPKKRHCFFLMASALPSPSPP